MIDLMDNIRPRILVVDDSADNLLAYRTTLSGEYDVVMVSSGREALRFLMEQEFALILLDVVMPDLDGFETAELIRARKKTSAVPIIFVSAYPPDDMQTFEGYSVGAADFISTPINPEILRAKVSAFLNLYRYNRAKEELLRRELLLEIERKESDRRLAEARRKTELLNQQREYEVRTAELNRQKFKELEQFAYVASHDLKAPLRTISNYLELFYAKYRGQIDMEADQYIQFVVAGAKKLNHLIDDLLNYSRLGSGVQKWEECDVKDTLEEVMQGLHAQIVESKAVISFDDLPKLQSDKTLLAQLFQNLIGNAITYRRPGIPPRIHISCTNNPDVGRLFKVTDNGCGFEMKFADQIFEMFRSLNKHEHGTGIGLAICKKIVQRHGGTIWAESKVGEGSTFSFTIPNVLNERNSLKGMRVLVVDDAPDIRVVSSRLLSTTGALYDCVEDAFAAIEKVKAQPYDVILLDILMPRMDGYEAKEKLRALGCKSPIVAFSTIEKRETFAEKGFADYLPKDALGETLLPFLQKMRAKSAQPKVTH